MTKSMSSVARVSVRVMMPSDAPSESINNTCGRCARSARLVSGLHVTPDDVIWSYQTYLQVPVSSTLQVHLHDAVLAIQPSW